MEKSAIALLSGGLDSTTLAYDLESKGYGLHLVSFDYGQRHRKELTHAKRLARDLNARYDIITLGVRAGDGFGHAPLGSVLRSSLTDLNQMVPDGHYAEESMKATVVPNRNAIMLSIAYGIGVAENADIVAFAAHAGDHAIYPDCRPEFVNGLNAALAAGNKWTPDTIVPSIIGPFLNMSKGEIATRAWELQVPIADTWSCYKGGEIHCGTCGTCYERREALQEAKQALAFREDGVVVEGPDDPTIYLDSTTMFQAPS